MLIDEMFVLFLEKARRMNLFKLNMPFSKRITAVIYLFLVLRGSANLSMHMLSNMISKENCFVGPC